MVAVLCTVLSIVLQYTGATGTIVLLSPSSGGTHWTLAPSAPHHNSTTIQRNRYKQLLYLEILVVPTPHIVLLVALVTCVEFTQDVDRCELPAEQFSAQSCIYVLNVEHCKLDSLDALYGDTDITQTKTEANRKP